jgi:hypothetical protein
VTPLGVDEAALDRLARNRSTVTASPLDVTEGRAIAPVVADVEAPVGDIDLAIDAAGVMPTGLLRDHRPPQTAHVMAALRALQRKRRFASSGSRPAAAVRVRWQEPRLPWAVDPRVESE